ncbi:WD40-repeat-containing domain protein [Geopyxis carbonaria]|nr:WD40-repeat-containing domain protein [Geopyxis carbonaria]
MASTVDIEAGLSKFPTVKTIVGSYTSQTKSKTSQAAEGGSRLGEFYAIQFYPFTKPGIDPVFAVVGGLETIVARPHDQKGIEVIQFFVDDGPIDEGLCALCWTRDKETGDPLLAVGGAGRIIKILNVKTGKCIQTLSGHGDELMDIQLHPCDQNIIASAAADCTIRIWSIDKKHREQPCLMVCAGEGHRETILSIAFHPSGRYLISGGMDHMINLWVIPEFPDDPTDDPIQLIYPHFSTSAVHSNYVDSLAFYGDYILSKAAAECKIVLWAIQNFNSKVPPPPTSKAPTTYEWKETRSAFGGSFERIMQFDAPATEPFYMRFGLFAQPFVNPILMMGTITGKVYMWDLAMIEKYAKGGGLGNDRDSASATPGESVTGGKIKRDDVGDIFGKVKAHHTLDIPKMRGHVRDIAFSGDGSYVVFCGEGSNITICKR